MKDIIIHQPLIRGGNDRVLEAMRIVDLMDAFDLRYRVNLIRYNPTEGSEHSEADEGSYRYHVEYYEKYIGASRVKIQPRVGFDAYCSCGMFHNGEHP